MARSFIDVRSDPKYSPPLPRGAERLSLGLISRERNPADSLKEPGVLLLVYRFAPRRANMRPPRTFVKRVNTTYCAFYLGQTQDVDACAPLWKSTQHSNRGEWEAALRLPPGAQAGCSEGFLSPRRSREERGYRPFEQAQCHAVF